MNTTNTANLSSFNTTFVPSGAAKWVGRILAGLAVAFLAFDTTLKLFKLGPAVEGTVKLGYPVSSILWLGLFELVCIGLYLYRRTAPLGALLFTGYFGGAVATHVRMGDPLFSHTLFPIYFAIALWLPLYLNDRRVRGILSR